MSYTCVSFIKKIPLSGLANRIKLNSSHRGVRSDLVYTDEQAPHKHQSCKSVSKQAILW